MYQYTHTEFIDKHSFSSLQFNITGLIEKTTFLLARSRQKLNKNFYIFFLM